MNFYTYLVRTGDSIEQVSRFHDTSQEDIFRLNPQQAARALQAGTFINLPFSGAAHDQSLHKYLALANRELFGSATSEPDWLAVARRELGQPEIIGGKPNPRIIEYLHSVADLSNSEMQDKDHISWCSCFVNWCFKQVDRVGTNSAEAQSWNEKSWGKVLTSAQIGAVAVFRRTPEGESAGWKGHVGFYLGPAPDASEIMVLGGNQGRAVSNKAYPIDGLQGKTKYEVLNYKWPS